MNDLTAWHPASCKCRDLKSSNVLLSADGCAAKVADVGAAAMMDAEYISQHFGTLAWAAPELLLADRASQLDEKVPHITACHPARLMSRAVERQRLLAHRSFGWASMIMAPLYAAPVTSWSFTSNLHVMEMITAFQCIISLLSRRTATRWAWYSGSW